MNNGHPENQLVTLPNMDTSRRNTRSLAADENERVRRALEKLLETHTQMELQDLSGISQTQISALLNNGRWGYINARRLAEFMGVSPDALLSGKEVHPEFPLQGWPGWSDAANQVRSRFPALAPYVDKAGRMRSPDKPKALTWEIVFDLANTLLKLDSR